MNTIERIEARQVFAPGGELDVRKYITLDEWAAIKAVVETARRLLPTLPAEVRRSGQSKGSNDMTTDKDRAEFEVWAASETGILAHDGTRYMYQPTHFAWLAWQASCSRSGAVPAAVRIIGEPGDFAPMRVEVAATPEPPQGHSPDAGKMVEPNAAWVDAVESYAASARVIALYLKEFCDDSLRYPDMIADAARKAGAEIERLRANTPRSGDAPFCIDLIAAWQARFQRNDGTWSEWGVYPDDVIQGIHKTGACEGFPAEIRPLYTAHPADARDAGQKHCCEHTIVAMVGPPVSAEFGFVHAIAWCVPSLPMGALLYAKRCEVDKQ